MYLDRLCQTNRQRAGGRQGARQVHIELEFLIAALRTELTDYGGMLVLLDEQEVLIREHSAAGLLDNVGALKAQMELVAANRKRRNELSDTLASALGLAASSSLGDVVALLPAEYQPLLRALIDEINELLFRCQQRVLLNNLLLTRQSPPLDVVTEFRFDAFAE